MSLPQQKQFSPKYFRTPDISNKHWFSNNSDAVQPNNLKIEVFEWANLTYFGKNSGLLNLARLRLLNYEIALKISVVKV